jgi:uncharacterized membrane protein
MAGGRSPQVSTIKVVKMAIIGALYAVITIAISPISYGPVQFRIAELFKVFVLFDPFAAIGIGIGTFFANLASPFVGPLELIWMPLTDIAGGLAAWGLFRLMKGRWPAVPMVLYSATTGFAVGLMLYILGVGGFVYLVGLVTLSELVILVGGIPLVFRVVHALRQRGVRLVE